MHALILYVTLYRTVSSAPGLESLQNRLPSSSPHKRQGFFCELWNELLHGGVWQDLQAVHPAGAGVDIKYCHAGLAATAKRNHSPQRLL